MANAKTPAPAKSSDAPKGAHEAPAFRKQYGRIVVATWPKTVTTAEGKQRETWVSCVTREYRDGDERKRTAYLFPEDLLAAAHALQQTCEEVYGFDGGSEEQVDA